MKLDAMVDLETLSTDDDAIIASIGIVKMDMQELRVLYSETIYAVFNWNDQFNHGRKCHPSTVRWWLAQSQEARDAILDGPPDQNNLALLNETLRTYMEGVDGVWGNGSDFDCKLMQSLYRTYDIPCPWKYSQHRCFRTMKNLYIAQEPNRAGTHHNALDDAVFQAQWLMNILREQRKIAASATGDTEDFYRYTV